MSSPQRGEIVQKYSCRCLNIAINAYRSASRPPSRPEEDYEQAFVGEHGISITHHYLTLRTRNHAQASPKSLDKLLQHLVLSCLACKTLVYRVTQEISPGAEAREGPVVPTEDWVEQETLRSKNGWIEVFVGRGGCLAGNHSIEQHLRSMNLSRTFAIGVLSPPQTATSPSIAALTPPLDVPAASSVPEQILPSLPPLFPPPPFTPSHPVFVSLSTCAMEKSSELRQRAEEETRKFVQTQLDTLEQEEGQLRREVEGIWRGYREGWKDALGRVNEERRRSATAKPDTSTPTASAKSGIPMSIRDFSPIMRSHSQSRQSRRASEDVFPPSPSLLSTSLFQSGAHLPNAAPQSPEADITTPERAPQSPLSHTPNPVAIPVSPQTNGTRSPGFSSMYNTAHSDTHMPGAFRRNMDTNIDIASSMAWAKGEEEMRRRLGGGEDGEPRDRARKRTSKNLGIGAVEKIPNPKPARSAAESVGTAPTDQSSYRNEDTVRPSDNVVATQSAHGEVQGRDPSPSGDVRSPTLEASGTFKKAKRRVTFDIQPNVNIVREDSRGRQPRKHVAEVELFDIDDLSSMELPSEFDLIQPSKAVRPQPVTRTPSYKLRANDGASTSRQFGPASMPTPGVASPRSPVNGNSKWTGATAKRSIGLADALPLLSSSVPAGDLIAIGRPIKASLRSQRGIRPRSPRTPSPLAEPVSQLYTTTTSLENRFPSPPSPPISNGAVEPAEEKLKTLFAASAPSHRHAWREGGRAWEMFHRRSRGKKKVKGTIAEEDGEDAIGGLDEGHESPSDDENENHAPWRNPSQFASSLPVQIRPLIHYKPTLEPKTSLADKQGVLVPPLKVTNLRSNSATAFRKAAYAERDRTRSIDPGPTLDFSEQEENEDEEDFHDDVGDGGRGRRHALSILQTRSVVPEAGMWRSMAS